MKTLYKWVLSIFPILMVLQGSTQNIQGWVFDYNEKDEPLVGVNVYWAETTTGTITNIDGYFNLPEKGNNLLLVFSFVGYRSDTLNTNGQGPIKVYLKKGAELREITVSRTVGASAISSIQPVLTQTITQKELAKFACCNLSESFETNASVDVSYADAVSGIKQIKMLGLSGRYSQLMVENVPFLRGAETAFGLDYIPGTWMQSIQVSKGTAAVKNGYESITGQINVNFIQPEDKEKLHFYAFANQDGKVETNAGYTFKVNDKWGSTILFHGGSNLRKMDMNNDGFMDKPLSNTISVLNRWGYLGEKLEARIVASVLSESRNGGQMNFDPKKNQDEQSAYGIGIDVTRMNLFSKIGYMFDRSGSSLGWISSVNYFDRNSFYGNNKFDAYQMNGYTNLIFQSYIKNTRHTFNTGVSLVYDKNDEIFNNQNVGFNEIVPGVFLEYNYVPSERFTLMLGLRDDYSSRFGNFLTPRMHAKYKLNKITTLRASAGKGYRSPLAVSENSAYLASSRSFIFDNIDVQEEAWNYGISMVNSIPVGKRDLSLSFEFFRTDFSHQLIVDAEQEANAIHFYSLNGRSYANSWQVELAYELFTRFDLNAGLRYNQVKATYNGVLMTSPFVSRYKGLISAQYRTRLDKWQFDATLQMHGKQRLPSVVGDNQNRYSENYLNLIAQITKNYRNWSFYVGGENINNFKQKDAIIDPENPFGDSFDASQVWALFMAVCFMQVLNIN